VNAAIKRSFPEAKIELKTVQGILRHSKIQRTFDLYTQEDNDEDVGAALRFKPHHQITFAAKNLLNTNSRAVI